MNHFNMQYDNNNKGALWISDKEKVAANPKFPRVKGKVTVDNKEYDVALFKNEKDPGSKQPDYRMILTPVEEREVVANNVEEILTDIPF